MSFNAFAIPVELRDYPNWCLWKFVDVGGPKPTKVPYSPNGYKANVNDPKTWGDFQTCLNCLNMGGYDGLGFMFSHSPYSGVDLDDTRTLADGSPNPNAQVELDRQFKAYHEFDSYSEVSPSGTGLHIIIKGNVAAGRRRAHIEIYSSGRFFTMTGNVYADKPIAERQSVLDQLWQQMGSEVVTTSFTGYEKELYSDEEVISQASHAFNGEKFIKLHEGRWNEIYASQSEADFAYVDILAFYSKNKAQIARLFLRSPLGARQKAKRADYIEKMITRSFDNIPPQIDFDGFKNALEDKLNANLKTIKSVGGKQRYQIPLPPGLIGQIAQFIYAAAPRPVEEYAIAGAIAFMSGICGRAYNISNTGLNQYMLMIGTTGTGKEAVASGISKLINTIKMQVPTASEFIGPSEISSGPALFKYLGQSNSFVSLLGEFGLRLQQMSNQHANGAEVSLRRMLLDLFNKSGHTDILYKSVYSDKDKNTPDITSPSFSLFGESTPEKFYGALSEDMVSEGLLPRFHIIEYNGPRVALNEKHSLAIPNFNLIDQLAALCAHAMTINHANPRRVVHVGIDPNALEVLNEFDRYATDQINAANKSVVKELWNRAHIKALKLAGLIAVGVNFAAPEVKLDHVQWATNLIVNDIDNLTAKFEAGEVGQIAAAENKQISELKKAIREWIISPWDKLEKYTGTLEYLYKERIVPYAYISKRMIAASAFKNDRTGATLAIKRTLQTLIDSDTIREVPKTEMHTKFGSTQRAFVVKDMTILD